MSFLAVGKCRAETQAWEGEQQGGGDHAGNRDPTPNRTALVLRQTCPTCRISAHIQCGPGRGSAEEGAGPACRAGWLGRWAVRPRACRESRCGELPAPAAPEPTGPAALRVHRTEPALGTGLVVESLGWKQVKPVALRRTSHLHRGVEGLRAHSSRWWSGWGGGGEQRSGRERASGQHPPGWRKLCTQTERGPNLEGAIHLATLKGVRPTANELRRGQGPGRGTRREPVLSPRPREACGKV